jgi:hypothetical protein
MGKAAGNIRHEKRWEKGGVVAKRALSIRMELLQAASAPNRILPRRGWDESADSFIGLAPTSIGLTQKMS